MYYMKKNNTRILNRVIVAAMALVITASGMPLYLFGDGIDAAYAKEKGKKNETAWQRCDNILNNTAPLAYKDYSSLAAGTSTLNDKVTNLNYGSDGYATTESNYVDLLGDGSVYVGGNARSDVQSGKVLDSDPNDFASVLPYGNVYLNVDKIEFDNATVVFPENSPFRMVKLGDKETGIDGTEISDDIYSAGVEADGSIVYLGSLTSYLSGVGAPGAYGTDTFGQLTEAGYTALINTGDTATQAAAHSNVAAKSYGNTTVECVDGQNIIRNTTDGYLYKATYKDAAVLPDGSLGDLVFTVDEMVMESAVDKLENVAYVVQGKANAMSSRVQVKFNNIDDNSTLRWPRYVHSPSADANGKDAVGANGTYKAKNAIGVSTTWSVYVIDKDGNRVDGNISYSVYDLDLASSENIWGRVQGDEYAEGLEIISGAQSYAVAPYYDHTNETTTENGWTLDQDRPLSIKRAKTGSNANGLRFAGLSRYIYRANNGKKVGGIDDKTNGDGTEIKIKTAYQGMTDNELYYLRSAVNDTFDAGFAVLLSSSGSTLRWTGSSAATKDQNVNTTLFDSSVFARITPSHGTGGGAYIETYKSSDCSAEMKESTLTTGVGTDMTVTLVPEDGYRVNSFYVGESDLDSLEPDSATYGKYTIVRNADGTPVSVKKDGSVVGTFTRGKAEITDTVLTATTKITVEANDDGSVDVTLDHVGAFNQEGATVKPASYVHGDFETDYYFTKVWEGATSADSVPDELEITAVPYVFTQTSVKVNGVSYKISEQGATYTGGGESYNIMGSTISLPYGTDEETGDVIMRTYVIEGNKLVHYTNGTADETIDINVTMKRASAASSNIKVTKDNIEPAGGEIEFDSTAKTVTWKIRYPSVGFDGNNDGDVTDESDWAAIPIETEPSDHNKTHIERYYWFAAEKSPDGWALLGYDNAGAETPGVVSDTYYDGEAWVETAIKDYTDANALIHGNHVKSQAFMSPLSSEVKDASGTPYTGWGGVIHNVQSILVKATKTWKQDSSNALDTRQEAWLHLDAKIDGTVIYDYLAPQKLTTSLGTDNTDNTETITWGEKTAYTSGENIVVVAKVADIPDLDGSDPISYTMVNNKYVGSNGKTYYVNDLPKTSPKGNAIEYIIRETNSGAIDTEDNTAKGTSAAGPDAYMVSYSTTIDEWADFTESETTIGEGSTAYKVPTYTGDVENKLNVVDFTVTKVWKENGAAGTGRTHPSDADVSRLKEAYILKVNDEDADSKLQPSSAIAYDTSTKQGILETRSGTDSEGNPTTTFTWHNIPKAIVKTEGGAEVIEEAVYSVTEIQLNGYDAPTYSNTGDNAETTDKALNNGTIINEVLPPEGEPRQTWGEKNKPQTANGKKMFDVTTETDIDGNPNKIEKVELIDPNTGKPADTVDAVDKDGNKVGTYTVDENDVITFTPEPDFVGDPQPVTVRGTDSNGLPAETTYTPHVVETTKKVTRTIEYFYDLYDEEGNPIPVRGEDGKPLKVVQVTEFAGTLNPETGEVIYPADAKGIMDEVESPDITNWNYDKEKVGEVTVYPTSNDMYEKVIYSPVGIKPTADVTYGLPNEQQKGEPKFEMEDETPGNITVKLIDPHKGEPVDGDTVDAVDKDGNKVGTYTLNEDGTVTFTPDKDYVGNPMPLDLEGTAENGQKARTTYTPHIVNPEITDTASRNIYYTYETKDGKEVTGSDKQTVTIRKHPKEVDPKTGEVLKWGDWEPTKFPALKNPDDKVDGKIWFTKDSVGEETVTSPGKKEDVHVVYQKIPYTVTYLDGKHGKSDGKGNQSGEDYGNAVTGGNGVKPAKGYKFTGKYTYVIKDHAGNVIGKGETDDPTSIEITGNIEFTPVYAPNKYTIKYDANGGTGTMTDQHFTGADSSAKSKSNKFVRDGYKFVGFKAKGMDGKYLKDENGNDLIFESEEDFIEYLHEMGDGSELTLVAQWEPVPEEPTITDSDPNKKTTSDPKTGKATKNKGVKTGDETKVALWIGLLASAVIAIAAVIIRRRRNER